MKLTNRGKVVSNKKMTFSESLYIPEILKGMAVTAKHIFKKPATIQFPEVKKTMPKVWRGHHVLKLDDEGRERCTACGLCAVACPAEAITMTAKERTKDEKHLYREEKYADVYEIDMLRCIFCGMCEDACPKYAIYMTDRLVSAEQNRGSFVYGKDKLVEKINARIDVSDRQTEKQKNALK